MLFQDANPTSLVGIFDVPKDVLVDYSFRIKMRQTADITVLIEDINGFVYIKNQEIDVSIGGGCGG
ncbi:MAG: thiosulfate oxidation carrier protein SoxY [Sulfurovum sp.]|nr:thiosulfate oxidation carrier protein SoxY [Sulfurovum sp.]